MFDRKTIGQQIQSILDQAVADGVERGVQAAAYLDGELVVDAWAGVADPATGRQVDGDTLFPVFSTTKGIASFAVHRLVERGELDLDRPLADLWPEFACNGKERTTLRHVLTHQAGLYPPPCRSVEEYLDWDLMCRKVAAMTPDWEPGAQTRYLSLSFSWLLGEPVRRATGRQFKDIVRDELVRPLGLKSLFFGTPPAEDGRVAPLERGGDLPAVTPNPDLCWLPLEPFANRVEIRRACLPAFNCMTSAKDLARCYAAIVGDGVDGVRLLSPETVRKISAPGQEGSCFGLGFALFGPEFFGHHGYGGSVAAAAPGKRLALALTKNRTSEAQTVRQAVYAALGL